MTSPANDVRVENHAAIVAGLLARNATLVARVAELERQIGLNSGNSGKPPFTDGLKKKPVTGKKPGGQNGHPGKTLSRAGRDPLTTSPRPAVTVDRY